MIPFIVLVGSFVVFSLLGLMGIPAFSGWHSPLRFALAAMFMLTASAHRGKRRADLIRMVPPILPWPGALVTLTGLLELAGAVGLLFRASAPYATFGLSALLVLLFPANVHAARNRLTIAGRPATALLPRAVLQIVFLAATLAVGLTSSQP